MVVAGLGDLGMAAAGLGDSGFTNGSVVDRRRVAPDAILQSQVHVMCSLKCLCESSSKPTFHQ